MSVLIKGMEMPKAGQVIEIAQNADGSMFARLELSFDPWHEVVTVQTPHGRLIDADALIERAWRERLDTREQIAEMINNAPTIEAEED